MDSEHPFGVEGADPAHPFGVDPPDVAQRADAAIQRFTSDVFNQFGYSARAAFGDEPVATPGTALSPQTEVSLKKIGVLNDYEKGRVNFASAVTELMVRDLAAGTQLALRAATATTAGFLGAAGKAGEDLGLAAPGSLTSEEGLRGAATDPGVAMLLGPLGMAARVANELRAFNLTPRVVPKPSTVIEGAQGALKDRAEAAGATTISTPKSVQELTLNLHRARAVGAIGEGEAGFYEARPPDPDHLNARLDAAREAGKPAEEPAPPLPEVPDVHTLARRVEPEAFDKFDALAGEKEMHRKTLTSLAQEREHTPEAIAASNEIKTILGKVNGVVDRLTAKQAERLQDAQDRFHAAMSTDTPEMATARAALQKADEAQRDLAPTISSAYRQAHEMLPDAQREAEQARAAAVQEGVLSRPVPVEPPLTRWQEVIQKAQEKQDAEDYEHLRMAHAQAGAREQDFLNAHSEITRIQREGLTGAKGNGQLPNGPYDAEGNVIEPRSGSGSGSRSGSGSGSGGGSKSGPIKTTEGSGDLKVRGLSLHIEDKAVEELLTDRFGDLPTYRQLPMAEQAQRAMQLFREDPDRAMDIALGKKQPPTGLLPESVLVAVERAVLEKGDVAAAQRLANSKLAEQATAMGQRIRALGERDESSPVEMIRDVQKAREDDYIRKQSQNTAADPQAVAKAKASTVKEIKTAIENTASNRPAWEDFINTITCKA